MLTPQTPQRCPTCLTNVAHLHDTSSLINSNSPPPTLGCLGRPIQNQKLWCCKLFRHCQDLKTHWYCQKAQNCLSESSESGFFDTQLNAYKSPIHIYLEVSALCINPTSKKKYKWDLKTFWLSLNAFASQIIWVLAHEYVSSHSRINYATYCKSLNNIYNLQALIYANSKSDF